MPGKRPQIGKMRHPVTVMKNQEVGDGRGGYTDMPVEIATGFFVSIEELSGRVLTDYQSRSEKITTLIKARYHPDINEKCWIVHELTGKIYQIELVIDVEERRIWLEILAYQER